MAAHHRWGRGSQLKRAQLHPDLQTFADELLRRWRGDLVITEGHREKAGQDKAYREGKSRARWGQSPHNRSPSYAVDIALLDSAGQIPWNDRPAWDEFGELGEQVARDLGLPVTWGGRFSGFYDGPHFELGGWKSVAVAS
jgi:peptidoglycan L-alanyl-D-glutamate endopeptidase CwlK